MPDSADKLEKERLTDTNEVRDDSEYVRLVISDEPRVAEADTLQPQAETNSKSFIWWIKATLWCLISIIILLIFMKWGVPFVFEKVLLPIMQWEATAFGHPVFALPRNHQYPRPYFFLEGQGSYLGTNCFSWS
ncbi:hypothetical protein U1Q18_002733 [Sarracenia purpurea var. burkii]